MQKLSPRLQVKSCWRSGYSLAFILGFLSLFVIVAPIMIGEQGYFIYYGDYNAQQMPFYHLAGEAVKSGSFGWNWYTDLGANFIGSYAFYLFGSPFFWLDALLPSSWGIYAMPVLLALKHGIAALTAYAYIQRFVKSRNAAIIGGVLYAFSGFQLFNIFFNHFQDVTAFFPLMLIAMEELVCKNRRGVFALTVALMAAINYFFFTGEAVFLVLYFIVRCFSKDFPANPRKFFQILLEAVLGVMIACVILLPAALALLSNYRITEHLYGLDLVAYNDKTRIWRIIQSFFMVPDVPARPNLFSSGTAKWASIGGYLPLFSMVGVIAFLKHRDGHWAKRLVIICMICAFIPVLNSSFYLFNGSYYARWYFMSILIMAMMTAKALDCETEKMPLKEGIWITGVFLLGFAAISALPVRSSEEDEITFFTLAKYPLHFYIVLGISVISLIAVVILAQRRKAGKTYLKPALILTVTASVICTASVVYFGASTRSYALRYIDLAIDAEDEITISVEEDNFFRTDISKDRDNYPMLWDLPSMRCFHSVVPGSIMEFYDAIDVDRDVASRPATSHYSLRGLFSVQYYFDEITDDNEDSYTCSLPGFSWYEDQNGFRVYQNDSFIPMGFTFDQYISREDWDELLEKKRSDVLIRALVLEEEQIEKYGHLMTEISRSETTVTKNDYLEECAERSATASTSFVFDSYGFTAEMTCESANLAFFSVPYEDGWSAKVNGEPVEIQLVDVGFMAVPVEEGENVIEFTYETPGLKLGAVISGAGVLLLIGYLLIGRRFSKTKKETAATAALTDDGLRAEAETEMNPETETKTEQQEDF